MSSEWGFRVFGFRFRVATGEVGSGEQTKKMNSIYNIWTSFEEKTGLREEQLMGLKITVGSHLTNYFFSNNSSILGLKI